MNAGMQGFKASFEAQYEANLMDLETLCPNRQNRAKVVVNFSPADADAGGHLRLSRLSETYVRLPPTGTGASKANRQRVKSVTETVLYPCAGITGTVLRYRISHCICCRCIRDRRLFHLTRVFAAW